MASYEPLITKEKFFSTYHSMNFANKSYTKYKKLFPIYESPMLASILGCLLTDGFLDIRARYKSFYFGYVGFFSKNQYELENFNRALYYLFRLHGEIRAWGRRDYGTSKSCIVTNSFISRVVFLADALLGARC